MSNSLRSRVGDQDKAELIPKKSGVFSRGTGKSALGQARSSINEAIEMFLERGETRILWVKSDDGLVQLWGQLNEGILLIERERYVYLLEKYLGRTVRIDSFDTEISELKKELLEKCGLTSDELDKKVADFVAAQG